MINYSDKEQETGFALKVGYQVEQVICGDVSVLKPNDAAVVKLSRE